MSGSQTSKPVMVSVAISIPTEGNFNLIHLIFHAAMLTSYVLLRMYNFLPYGEG